jgi:hypothetical protein
MKTEQSAMKLNQIRRRIELCLREIMHIMLTKLSFMTEISQAEKVYQIQHLDSDKRSQTQLMV